MWVYIDHCWRLRLCEYPSVRTCIRRPTTSYLDKHRRHDSTPELRHTRAIGILGVPIIAAVVWPVVSTGICSRWCHSELSANPVYSILFDDVLLDTIDICLDSRLSRAFSDQRDLVYKGTVAGSNLVYI